MGNGNSNERNRVRNDGSNSPPNRNRNPRNPVPYSPNTQVLPPPPAGYYPTYPTPPYDTTVQYNYSRPPYFYPGIPPPPTGVRPVHPYGSWMYPTNPQMQPQYYPYPQQEQHRPILTDSQSTVTIKNEVNVNRSTLKFISDPDSPGKYLINFSFDSTTNGSFFFFFLYHSF
jgi:hypothetical protein